MSKLNELFVGMLVKSRKYGQGVITDIEVKIDQLDICGKIKFDSGEEREIYINRAVSSKSLTLIADIDESLYTDEINNVKAAKEEKEQKILEAKKAEEAKLLQDKEQEEFNKKIERAINRLNKAYSERYREQIAFLEAVKWLKDNTKNITAVIPDYCTEWFNKHFGAESPRKVIDSTRVTSGGYSMKWSPSFTLKLSQTDDLPEFLVPFVKGKQINNTSLICQLVADYDFSFGN